MSFSKPLFLRERGEQPTEGGRRRVSRAAEARASRSERGEMAAQPREHGESNTVRRLSSCVCVCAPGVREPLLAARNGPRNAAFLVRFSAHTRCSSRVRGLAPCRGVGVAQRARRRGGATRGPTTAVCEVVLMRVMLEWPRSSQKTKKMTGPTNSPTLSSEALCSSATSSTISKSDSAGAPRSHARQKRTKATPLRIFSSCARNNLIAPGGPLHAA